jgi:outer membrane protein
MSSRLTFIKMRTTVPLLALMSCLPLMAQVAAEMNSPIGTLSAPWTGSGAYFRKTFPAPDTRVVLKPPIRLQEFVIEGKLTLSLKNYLDLVLTNNTDIAVQRLNLEIPKDAITRAFGVFDPLLSTSFSATRSTTPSSSSLEGALILKNLTQPFSLRYQQTIPTGTQFFSSVSWSKLSSNDSYQYFNPNYQNNWQMGFVQPLLRGRGTYINKLPITIARSQSRVQDFLFQDQVQRLLVTAENYYWDVVLARERIKVQEQALSLAKQSLDRAKKEVELGATSPLEIFQPEQQYATAQIALTQVQYQLVQAEDVLRRQIGADLIAEIRDLPIVLTEKAEADANDKPMEREGLVKLALLKRPDLKAQIETVTNTDLQLRLAADTLKPTLSLGGYYSTYGRGGPAYFTTADGTPIYIPGGPSNAWGQMFGFSYPTYYFSLTLNLPLRDRQAAANVADAAVTKKQAVLREQSAEQQVRQDVLNAITQVESSLASVKLAKIAVDYSIKRVDADQKRYDLGVINLFFLLSSQTDLTNAQSNLVNQLLLYRRNVLNLQQRLGTLPEEKGIVIQ